MGGKTEFLAYAKLNSIRSPATIFNRNPLFSDHTGSKPPFNLSKCDLLANQLGPGILLLY